MNLLEIKEKALSEIENAPDLKTLEQIRVKYLGRKGEITFILRSLGKLPLEERKKIGPELNGLKKELEDLLDKRKEEIGGTGLKEPLLDFTKPGKRIKKGHLHPLTCVEEDIRRIFTSMNFSIIEGPEIETEHYNFDALNIPANHPSRDMWDTFWLKSGNNQESKNKNNPHFLLRTHTSPMQIRYMETHEPPFQIIVPGRVFRYEATDFSHEINFYQVEGLMVGSDITLANFKFIVEEFFKKFFSGREIEFRFRPSYFPFVEPGLEVDIKLSGDNWFEVMGAGMVHRKVFDVARYNPDQIQGFAFGMGLDRLAMIKYKIPDIRLFYSGDLRFIHQF